MSISTQVEQEIFIGIDHRGRHVVMVCYQGGGYGIHRDGTKLDQDFRDDQLPQCLETFRAMIATQDKPLTPVSTAM